MTFAQDGFAIAPLFGPDEVAELRGAVSEHMDRTARALLKPYGETEFDAPFDQRLEKIAAEDQSFAGLLGTAVATDAHRSSAITRLAEDPRLEALASGFCGLPISQKIFRMRLNCSALTGKRQGWHSDVARVDDTACSQLVITAWIPLSDAGPDSGGLEFVRGRRDAPVSHDETGGKFLIDQQELDKAEKATPLVLAGQCLFMDCFTPHRAVENHSGRTRWSLVVWMKADRLPTYV